MSVNNFKPRKFHDHVIVDGDNKVVGTIRIKPSGIHWAPRDAKLWYAVSLENFARFMQRRKTKRKKK